MQCDELTSISCRTNVTHERILSEQGGRNGGESGGQQPVTEYGSEAERQQDRSVNSEPTATGEREHGLGS